MTRTAFAKALGISRERLYQLIAMGMPTVDLEQAQQWRALNTSRRAPTNGQNVGMIQITTKDRPKKRRKRVTFQATGDSLYDALQSARLMRQAAFDLVAEAIAEDDIARLPIFISIHNKTAITNLKAEKMYRVELERRKTLVPTQAMIELGRRVMEAVVRRVKRLADESGPQCNPENPLLAVNVLERAANEILLAAQRAIHDLNSLDKQA